MTLAQFNYEPTLRGFVKTRNEWVKILSENPDNTDAAETIVRLNAKIILIRGLRPAGVEYDG